MHTVLKGFVEDAIAWTVVCLYALSDIDWEYSDNMNLIDKRIKQFPVNQSLVVFPNNPNLRWCEGISHLFKNSWRRKGDSITGFFANGSIEAWKLPQLLFQLIFCINKRICPFDTEWSKKFLKQEWLKNKNVEWNVGQTIINSLASVLEVHFVCRKTVLTESDIETRLPNIIGNARTHMTTLRLLKHALTTALKKKKNQPEDDSKKRKGQKDPEDQEYGGIKHHLAIHIPYFKRKYGADMRTTDTELAEREHKVQKVVFEHTNKQYSTTYLDMLFHNRIKCHYQNIQSHRKETDISNVDADDDGDVDNNHDGYYFKTVNTFGIPDRLIFKDGSVHVKQEIKFKNKFRSKNPMYKPYSTLKLDSDGINHLIFTYNELMQLADNSKDKEFSDKWLQFKQGSLGCRLVKSVQCSIEKNQKSKHDFLIHCNGRFSRSNRNGKSEKQRNVCDFIEVGTDMARLVAIFSFTPTTSSILESRNEDIFLVVCWMKKVTAENKSVLPYDSYEYEMVGKGRNEMNFIQIVSIDNIYRPAFLILHFAETDLKWGNIRRAAVDKLKQQIFYHIPYELIITDDCEGFVGYEGEDTVEHLCRTTTSNDAWATSTRQGLSLGQLPSRLSSVQQIEIYNALSSSLLEINDEFGDICDEEDSDSGSDSGGDNEE